jgi:methionine-S-sulfoxide reductase
MKTAVFAAGCFWGVEELIREVEGVESTEVGYSGGETKDPTYETIKRGDTGHAEAVQVTYDPSTLSYENLLKLFFRLHDPTTLNRQGGDIGTQYRSSIFVQNEEERSTAEKVIAEENRSGRHKRPVLTSIEPFTTFYPAEAYHQDYLRKNPGGYTCHFWRGPDPE